MSKYLTIKMTTTEAEAIGLLVCESCGWPRNNHFSYDKKICAHAEYKCKGWKQTSKVGRIVKRKN